MDALFEPLTLGDLELPNRILMAPLTRGRSEESHVPNDLQIDYYAQRAGAGLIISEATGVHPKGMGWYRAPGIWSNEMVAAWKPVTEAVHARGGRVFLQLWHMGRVVLPTYIGGEAPLAPSAVTADGEGFVPVEGQVELGARPYVEPKAMDQADIDEAVAAYGRGAANARDAGFDGVEIHAANGYLIDQFLRSGTNRRTDDYGGSAKNRARFLREVTDAVLAELPPGRVGVRISPTSSFNDMSDEAPAEVAAEVGRVAEQAKLAYVHLIEPVEEGFMPMPDEPVAGDLRSSYSGPILQNGAFDAETGAKHVADKAADAIVFGRPFIANPDLAYRIREGKPLAEPNMELAYVGGANGYSDYPPYDEQAELPR
ncbi:hypothetical protein B5C34_04610 [Pacificimonas flava]|uniref:NADH:flavin oxidoreductase/NADH oxidase N-terminal domain-containing protein n=2 Tax=Pacificimonas TaxID=1960290 RepID=A0A219B8E6_9SPHN|nr:alkene reductase [Pacificimonas aurantium]OWV34635.1 hypothetical protein B5C34_04610 [Pacificimonas flava]